MLCIGVALYEGSSTQASCQAEVDEFDLAAGLVDTHDVLGLEVQVDNALAVDVAHPVHDLEQVLNHLSLRQLKVLIDDPLKQLPTRDPVNTQYTHYTQHYTQRYTQRYTQHYTQRYTPYTQRFTQP